MEDGAAWERVRSTEQVVDEDWRHWLREEDLVHYFVHGVDTDAAGELLEGLAESHQAYMDAHVDRLVARGPTLSAHRSRHTGSVHVVEAATIEDARRFALEEPGSPSSLVLATWPGAAGECRPLLRRLADVESLAFGGLLTSDDGTHSVGLVAAVDADLAPAAALVAGAGLPGSTTSLSSRRWRRGGRNQTP